MNRAIQGKLNFEINNGCKITGFTRNEASFLVLVAFSKNDVTRHARLDLGKRWFIDEPIERPTIDQTFKLTELILNFDKPVFLREWWEIVYFRGKNQTCMILPKKSEVESMKDLIPFGSKYRVLHVVRKGPQEPKWKVMS